MNSAFLLRMTNNSHNHPKDSETLTGIPGIATPITEKSGDISIEIGETIDKILTLEKNDGGSERKRFGSRSVSPTLKEIYAA